MKIGNSEFLYHIDYLNERVHVLDLSRSNFNLLINEVSPSWQEKLLEEQRLLKSVLDFDWLLYLHDGHVARYNEYQVKFVNAKMPYLYEPYLEFMEERKKR